MRLLVLSAAILEISTGRCASGNDVLGAGAEVVRFTARPEAGLTFDNNGGVELELEVERRRSGREGTAKVGDVEDVSFEALTGFSRGVEINVNGLIG